MRCTVVWNDEAEQKLLNLWLGAAGRAGITAAANWIDQHLRANPFPGQNQSGEFTLQRYPLEVTGTFSPLDCLIRIKDVVLLD